MMAQLRKRTGFSIIELIVAVTILMIGLAMVIGVFPHTYKTTQFAKTRLQAVNIAEQKLEYARTINFSDLANPMVLPINWTAMSLNPDLNEATGKRLDLTYCYRYTVLPDAYTTGVKFVRIEVSWRNKVELDLEKAQGQEKDHYKVKLETKVLRIN